ncbi:SDR family NAD(P)-dependent oxidoreductase [Phycisphaeraceae bacterium D3-23]
MARDLTDKVVLITGASSGIGAATALMCARAGMHVSLVARRADKLEAVAKQVSQLGGKAQFFTANVSRSADMQAAVEACWKTFGRLDAVFANAGYGLFEEVLETRDDQARAIFDTNYFGTVYTAKAALPKLNETISGLRHILICSSAASEIGVPKMGVYSATKAAQDSIAGAMRAELHDSNIHVTSVHPIGTRTPFVEVAGGGGHGNTPAAMQQSAEHVAKCVLRSLKRPCPEVWPSRMTRVALAAGTLCPRFAAWAMRRHYRKLKGSA